MTHRPPVRASGLRTTVERVSATPMIFLVRRKVLVFAAFVVLLIATVALRGPVSLLPGVVMVATIGWLTYLSWPTVPAAGRAARGVILAAVVLAVLLHAAS